MILPQFMITESQSLQLFTGIPFDLFTNIQIQIQITLLPFLKYTNGIDLVNSKHGHCDTARHTQCRRWFFFPHALRPAKWPPASGHASITVFPYKALITMILLQVFNRALKAFVHQRKSPEIKLYIFKTSQTLSIVIRVDTLHINIVFWRIFTSFL